MPRFRIVAIAQIHNEIRRGNLERFFTYLKPLVNEIVIYDDSSTDGSYEYAQLQTGHVIRGTQNSFLLERDHRRQLLEYALTLKPDAVLWLDADEVLTTNANEKLQSLCKEMLSQHIDAYSFHELNLWRSGSWRRLDNAYDDGWFVRLWRVSPSLQFGKTEPGLHQQLYPDSIKRIVKTEAVSVIHYGFASDDNLAYKYLNYRRHGQHGWKLNRFLDETTLKLEQVDQRLIPNDLYRTEPAPQARSLPEWQAYLDTHEKELLRPSISIVSMIYKSTAWLQFCYDQILKYTNLNDKEFFFVANDPTDEVVAYLNDHYIPHVIFRNTPEHLQEWYINNVYRAYNFGAQAAQGDYVLFVNSDMAYSPGWVEQLVGDLNGKNCVAARLVESGKLPSGDHAISKNFGQALDRYDETGFLRYADAVAENRVIDDGLFMPLLIKRWDLLDVGGYPEGNIVPGTDIFHPQIAKRGQSVLSGDRVLMQRLAARGVKHQTSFSSMVYHFQEGEKDDPPSDPNINSQQVIIVNDYLTGRMGEKVMWQFLLERLPGTAGVDLDTIGQGPNFAVRAREYIRRHYPQARCIIQNGTFIDLIDPQLCTIALLQDNLRGMGRPNKQQDRNLQMANVRVANSLLTASAYPEYNFDIIPLGIDDQLFSPQNKRHVRQELHLTHDRIGIFVGDLSDTKGWPEIRQIINERQDIHWLVVVKSEQRYEAPNVTMFNRIEQKLLTKLLCAADFFILGSPVETQCLAALEACLCDTPVIMHLTGIFKDFSERERKDMGYFSDRLDDKIELVLKHPEQFHPRSIITNRGLTIDAMVSKWNELLVKTMTEANQQRLQRQAIPRVKIVVTSSRRIVSLIGGTIMRMAKNVVKFFLPKRIAEAIYRFLYQR